MIISPKTPRHVTSEPDSGSTLEAFLRLRDVTEGVACLDLGRNACAYHGIIKVNAVNFAFMPEADQDMLIAGFKEFLNSLSFPIQILARNLAYPLHQYLANMEAIEGNLAEMAHDHANFVRQLASDQIQMTRAFYIIVPADHVPTRNPTDAFIQAQNQIEARQDELLKQLARMGLTGFRLQDRDIILLYQSCFFSKEGTHNSNRQNQEVPSEAIVPAGIEVYPQYMRIDGASGEHEFVRSLTIANYPRSAYPGWINTLIQMNEPHVDFSFHITPLNPQQVNKLRHEAERSFDLSVIILIRGRTEEELMERNKRILTAIDSIHFRAFPAHWQHHIGFLSCLPNADNQLGQGHLFSASSASTFYPFTSSNLNMERGALFGIRSGGDLIILNPFNRNELENANLVVLAASGAGKSFFLKTVASRLLPTCNVYAIDQQIEYNAMCERVGGQFVVLSPGSLQFNPLELYAHYSPGAESESAMDEQTFFREKLENLVSLFAILLTDNGSLTQQEQSFLFHCLIKTYKNRDITADPATHKRPIPSIKELHMVMSSFRERDDCFGVGPDTYGLAERLERYMHSFPNRTRGELSNRLIDFNISELSGTLKPFGLLLILDFFWTYLRQARRANVQQRHSLILIDEAWLLMQFPAGAKFLTDFAKCIRQYSGGLWCATRNPVGFLNSGEGRTLLATTAMKFLMRQDSSTIDAVTSAFHLDTLAQRNFLLKAQRGAGLFFTQGWTDMQVVASSQEVEHHRGVSTSDVFF